MSAIVWQVIDSAFPSGGFAHSSGLEAAAQHGYITGADGVRTFARHALAQAGRGGLPLVSAAHRSPGRLRELDELCDAFLSSPVANRASRTQGRALAAAIARSFDAGKAAIADARLGAFHYAPVFGALMRELQVPLDETRRGFLFVALRGVTSAAVRLGLAGSYEAQAIQFEAGQSIDAIVQRFGDCAPEEIAQSAPLIDIFQSNHDRLYSRLFQS